MIIKTASSQNSTNLSNLNLRINSWIDPNKESVIDENLDKDKAVDLSKEENNKNSDKNDNKEKPKFIE